MVNKQRTCSVDIDIFIPSCLPCSSSRKTRGQESQRGNKSITATTTTTSASNTSTTTARMICKMIKFFLGAVLVHYLALLADVQQPVIESMPLFEATTKWSAPDVWQMARTDTMATVVSLLTGAVHGTGAPEIQLDE